MTDSKNTILAIVLSAIVLIVWQYFFAIPQEKARQEQLAQQQTQAQKTNPPAPGQSNSTAPAAAPVPGAAGAPPQVPGAAPAAAVGAPVTRDAAIAASPRVKIATESLQGSILKLME